jgi:hypothetical protein
MLLALDAFFRKRFLSVGRLEDEKPTVDPFDELSDEILPSAGRTKLSVFVQNLPRQLFSSKCKGRVARPRNRLY